MARLNYETVVETITGEKKNLTEYEGKVLLIVNTASRCGFTPQFKGLEAIHQEFSGRGLAVLGFPCNQFGFQDPGSNGEIAEFCELRYGVTFPMHAKIEVNGGNTHPLFVQLKEGATGLLGTQAIKWNFTKFLVGRDGTILKRYGSRDTPAAILADIRKELAS